MKTIPYRNRDTGEECSYTVKTYDELTLADYKRIADIPWADINDEWDVNHRIDVVARYCGLPAEVVDRRPMSELHEVYDDIVEQLRLAKAGSDTFNKSIGEEVEYVPPVTIEIGGKTYAVPYDLEMDTVAAQWADWQSWEVPEQEADLIAEAMAFLLVERGQDYAGTPKEKVAAIMEMRVCDAFDLCAFFFAKSERFRIATDHRRTLFLTLIRQRVDRELKLLPEGIEGLTSSTGPQK